MEASGIIPSCTSQENDLVIPLLQEIGSLGDDAATASGSMSPVPSEAGQVITEVIQSDEILRVSPPGSDEAAAVSGSGACFDADQLDDSYETVIDEFLRHMREEALRDSSEKQGNTADAAAQHQVRASVHADAAGDPHGHLKRVVNSEKSKVDGENKGEDEEVPRRRRRKQRVSFKRLGSEGRPFYQAKVVEEKEPYQCYRCSATFTFKRELEYHLRMHSGAPLLPCDFCPLEFPTGRMLSNHCARKHGRPSLAKLPDFPPE